MEQLKNLLQIKKIIALVLTFVFAVLSFKGQIDANNFLSVFLVVIGFYYGQSTANDSKNVPK